jgi:hypothetical protein
VTPSNQKLIRALTDEVTRMIAKRARLDEALRIKTQKLYRLRGQLAQSAPGGPNDHGRKG